MKKVLFIFGFIFAMTPLCSEAFSVEYSPNVIISNEKIFEENLYVLGGKVNFDNFLEKDLTILSGKSNIKGAIFGDLLNISAETYFNGESFGDTRFLGGEVNISGNTNSDLIIVSAKTNIDSNSIVNGNTLILAGEANIEGQILENMKIFAAKVYINSEVQGDLEITTQDLYLGPNANIVGNVVYFSPKKAGVADGAIVKNKFVYNQIESLDDSDFIKRTVLSFVSFWAIIKFLSNLFTAFILVFVFRMFSQRVSIIASENFGKSILVGFLSILLLPISIVILIASLFGIPLAFLLFLISLGILLLTGPVAGIVLGYLIKKKIHKEKRPQVDFNSTALGIVALTFLYFIPFFGAILKTIITITIFGAIIFYLFEKITIKKQK